MLTRWTEIKMEKSIFVAMQIVNTGVDFCSILITQLKGIKRFFYYGEVMHTIKAF